MTHRHSKVLPTKWHTRIILVLSVFAAFTAWAMPYGWVMFIWPVLIYLDGRGYMEKREGLKK